MSLNIKRQVDKKLADITRRARAYTGSIFAKPAKIGDAPVVYALVPDAREAYGGIRYIYRHVDALNKNGCQAFVVHQRRHFRCDWFDNNTAVLCKADVRPRSNDFLLIPEVCGPSLAKIAPGTRKVILNQNAFYTFNNYSLEKSAMETAYFDKSVVAVFCTSKHVSDSLEYVFPRLKTAAGSYGVDTSIFRYERSKQNIISYMPRKLPRDAAQVINILKFRGALNDFSLLPIGDMRQPEVAQVMRQSLFFLCFSDRESFGLPAAEAMACGCIVVGYHGIGGLEFFKEQFSYPVPATDVFAFAKRFEEALHQYKTAPERIEQQRREAAAYIRDHYSPEEEEQRVVAFWRGLLAS